MRRNIVSLMKKGIRKPHRIPPFVLEIFTFQQRLFEFKRKEQLNTNDFRYDGVSDVKNSLFRHTNFKSNELNKYAEEIHESQHLYYAHLNLAEHRSIKISPPSRSFGLYSLVRHYKPKIIVETGVLDGLSTVYLLEAMRQNDSLGNLYSIDSPAPNLPPNKDPGWIIPDELRDNWDLILGKSQDELEPLLNRIDSPDMFYHDSWHTYPVMSYEFQTIADNMVDGIISGHDVNRNHAFLELCSRVNSSVNVDRPFKIGKMGAFGFALVGKLSDDIPSKYPGWQY